MLLESEDDLKHLPLKNRAYIASMARYAARLYARERCRLPGRWAACLYDAVRHGIRYGRWSWTGMTVDEIWLKYEMELRNERGLPDPREKDAWKGEQNVGEKGRTGALSTIADEQKERQERQERQEKLLYKVRPCETCNV